MKRKSSSFIEKLLSFILFLLFLATGLFFFYFKNLHSYSVFKMRDNLGVKPYSIKENFIDNDTDIEKDKKQGKDKEKKKNKLGEEIRLELPSIVTKEDIIKKSYPRNNKVIFYLKNTAGDYTSKYNVYGNLEKSGIKDVVFSYNKDSAIFSFIMSKDKYVKYKVKNGYLYIYFIEPSNLYKKVITIDALLGGSNQGKIFNNTSEAKINRVILDKVKKRLEVLKKDRVKFIYINSYDKDLSIDERIGIARDNLSDIFISIGMNKTGSGRMSNMKGVSVEYLSLDEKGKKIANYIMDSILSNTNSQSRGVIAGDEDPILSKTTLTSVVVRVGFSTNEEERKSLTEDKKQEEIAKGIADALIRYINEGN